MKIIKAFPPNWDKIIKVFNPDKNRVVITYGDTIYNPGDNPIDLYLLNHEMVHEEQQKKIGIEAWWNLYLSHPQFMLEQELEAYRHQYKTFCKDNTTKKVRQQFLDHLAEDLASETYGNNISTEAARSAIKNKRV